jgi:hypothetical protein
MRGRNIFDAIQDFINWIEEGNGLDNELESWYEKDNSLKVWFRDGREAHYFWIEVFYYLSERNREAIKVSATPSKEGVSEADVVEHLLKQIAENRTINNNGSVIAWLASYAIELRERERKGDKNDKN